jgi:urease accessory protein
MTLAGIDREACPTEPLQQDACGQQGLAELRFEHRHGRTRLTSLQTHSPLAVQRALYPDELRPDMAHVIVANPTAGLLSSDRHVINVHVGTGARARVTTQAATKVFSMPSGHAEQRLGLTVDKGGVLEYVAHAAIPFRWASLEQHVDMIVPAGGTALFADVLSLGRVESGERLAFRSVAMHLSVRRPAGNELYIESYRLQPTSGYIDAPGILGEDDAAAIGTLILVTDRLLPEQLCDAVQRGAHNGVQTGVAALPGGGGIVVKTIASSAARAEAVLRDAMESMTECAQSP